MTTTIEQVKEFHKKFGVPIADEITVDDWDVACLRLELLSEELDELAKALRGQDAVEVLDALTDLQYVLDGTYLSLGLHDLKDRAFKEVHRSNMSKLDEDGTPILREDGKVLKGPNYSPPYLRDLVEVGRDDD